MSIAAGRSLVTVLAALGMDPACAATRPSAPAPSPGGTSLQGSVTAGDTTRPAITAGGASRDRAGPTS